MWGEVSLFAGGWVLGMVTAVPLLRRRAPVAVAAPAPPPVPVLPFAVQEAVTAFGEELARLPFDPTEPGTAPAVLKEYRAALDAYERATSAGTPADVMAALHAGRAALIRMEARQAGRPVPIDALPRLPDAAQSDEGAPDDGPLPPVPERFVITGTGNGEHLIDRPEPGRFALLEFRNQDAEYVRVEGVIRTEDLVDRDGALLTGTGHLRATSLLDPGLTHFAVGALRDGAGWSARVRPLTDASPLETEWRGTGYHVLSYGGGPALLTVQARGETHWRALFVCGCLRGWDCDCPPPRWPAGTPDSTDAVYGTADGRKRLRLPRAGYLDLSASDGGGEWYLTLQPVQPSPPPQRRRRKKPRRSAA
ncbi:hypothetical protein ACL02R_12755 [Streptomyces sp. MS19]|uniref:hypothetical protein n=1 Tax=Streptomyces sp. MS19 TaxID=3385972 RepID=UPI0039A0F197